jgi:hypothetical protein
MFDRRRIRNKKTVTVKGRYTHLSDAHLVAQKPTVRRKVSLTLIVQIWRANLTAQRVPVVARAVAGQLHAHRLPHRIAVDTTAAADDARVDKIGGEQAVEGISVSGHNALLWLRCQKFRFQALRLRAVAYSVTEIKGRRRGSSCAVGYRRAWRRSKRRGCIGNMERAASTSLPGNHPTHSKALVEVHGLRSIF